MIMKQLPEYPDKTEIQLRTLFWILLVAFLCIPPWFHCSVLWAQGPEEPQEIADWTGQWDTNWRSGKARMILTQDSAKVTGSYEPFGGQLVVAHQLGIGHRGRRRNGHDQ